MYVYIYIYTVYNYMYIYIYIKYIHGGYKPTSLGKPGKLTFLRMIQVVTGDFEKVILDEIQHLVGGFKHQFNFP